MASNLPSQYTGSDKTTEHFINFHKRQYLKLMYVWGHSYEFDQADNWEVIERFCEYAGGSFVKLGGPCR